MTNDWRMVPLSWCPLQSGHVARNNSSYPQLAEQLDEEPTSSINSYGIQTWKSHVTKTWCRQSKCVMCTTNFLPFHPFSLFPISSLSLTLTRSSGFPSGPGLTPVPADGQLGATDGPSEDVRWGAGAYLWITSPEKSSWSPIHAAGRAGCLIRASDAGCDHHAFQIQKKLQSRQFTVQRQNLY